MGETPRAIFGPGCDSRARSIAQADADQDKLPGFISKLEFVIGVGGGWRKGSIHFGGPVDQLLHNAFSKCDDKSLGAALHGLQDDMSHSGVYSQPLVHYITSVLGPAIGDMNPADNPGLQLINGINDDTASILRQYKQKCAKCCK